MNSPSTTGIDARQWRQAALITVAAAALYLGFRALPVGSDLNHIDFRAGPGAIEFCDPANPQFIPVVSVRSPVSLTLSTAQLLRAGQDTEVVVRLATATGKPIGENDLLISHTRKLHLLIVDETLEDYQHVHPEPGETPGDWRFRFKPLHSGPYRVFADFMPMATGRGLYSSTDVNVSAGPQMKAAPSSRSLVQDRGALRFELQTGSIKAGQAADLVFQVARTDGRPVGLRPVMDAFAHLVAFDIQRSGFAHLHPLETDLSRPPDVAGPRLSFRVTIPNPGRYVIWAQMNIDGEEVFVPFSVDVG